MSQKQYSMPEVSYRVEVNEFEEREYVNRGKCLCVQAKSEFCEFDEQSEA